VVIPPVGSGATTYGNGWDSGGLKSKIVLNPLPFSSKLYGCAKSVWVDTARMKDSAPVITNDRFIKGVSPGYWKVSPETTRRFYNSRD
jgi:hypothetical protein